MTFVRRSNRGLTIVGLGGNPARLRVPGRGNEALVIPVPVQNTGPVQISLEHGSHVPAGDRKAAVKQLRGSLPRTRVIDVRTINDGTLGTHAVVDDLGGMLREVADLTGIHIDGHGLYNGATVLPQQGHPLVIEPDRKVVSRQSEERRGRPSLREKPCDCVQLRRAIERRKTASDQRYHHTIACDISSDQHHHKALSVRGRKDGPGKNGPGVVIRHDPSGLDGFRHRKRLLRR